jgi:hypothetical protein
VQSIDNSEVVYRAASGATPTMIEHGVDRKLSLENFAAEVAKWPLASRKTVGCSNLNRLSRGDAPLSRQRSNSCRRWQLDCFILSSKRRHLPQRCSGAPVSAGRRLSCLMVRTSRPWIMARQKFCEGLGEADGPTVAPSRNSRGAVALTQSGAA